MCVVHTSVVEPVEVAEAFAKHFQLVCHTSSVGWHSALLSNDFLQLPPISELDIFKAIKGLRPSKPTGLDGIPRFMITSETFRCLLLRVITLHLLDVFRLVTVCAKTSIPLGNPLLIKTDLTVVCCILKSTYLCF
jgi:hypothetical protein